MPDFFENKIKSRFSASGVGTTAGVTVTQAASGTAQYAVTHISGSSDAACIVTIESPASTILWRKRFAAAGSFSENLPLGCYIGAHGAAVLAKISASSSNSELNIAGFVTG